MVVLHKQKKALTDTNNVYFQPSFNTNKDVFAHKDILERLADGTWHIYEVKSSPSTKKDRRHRQICRLPLIRGSLQVVSWFSWGHGYLFTEFTMYYFSTLVVNTYCVAIPTTNYK
jgi:hypothetical protein